MNTTSKQLTELTHVERLLHALESPHGKLLAGDRPDVIVELDGRRVGIEVTIFHSDETITSKGSPARAAEQKANREFPNRPCPSWQTLDPTEGIVARIIDKIAVSEKYDRSAIDELRLLIVTSVGIPGAVASTSAIPAFVNLDKLNAQTHEVLRQSKFSVVYIHGHLSRSLFYWLRSSSWQTQSLPELPA